MRESDFTFANQVRAAAELRTPRTSRMLLGTIILLLITGTTWAHFAILDEVKRGQGKVIPSRQMQVLQSLEGGLVEEIAVQEGDTVQKGQVLARIDNTKFSADLGEVKARRFDGYSYKIKRDGSRFPDNERHFSIWISADADRVPLRMTSGTDYGDIEMSLVDYATGPRS